MFDSFRISFLLRNTYRTNSLIYRLKSLPFAGRLLPSSLYSNKALKTVMGIMSIICEFVAMFIPKALYLLVVWLISRNMRAQENDCFANIMIFLALIGGIINTQILDPSKDKFYAMFLMRMKEKKYILTSYVYFLVRTFLGFLPFTLIFGKLSGAQTLSCLCIPLYTVCVKLCFTAAELRNFKLHGRKKNSTGSVIIRCTSVFVLLCLASAGFVGYVLGEKVLWAITACTLIPAAMALKYIIHFDSYRSIARELMKPEHYNESYSRILSQSQQQSMQGKIDEDASFTSSKTGYQYFNELFMKRHSGLLTKSAKRITAAAAVCLAVCIAVVTIIPDFKPVINKVLMNYLPYFLFIMYLINRGGVITQAMFMNCDHSMLAYRFYRKPQALLRLFADRLRYVVGINLMPAAVIAPGLPLLLYLTGGTEQPLNYLVLFFSVSAMSVFFSVHNMVIYYLLQPYNIELEKKNAAYSVVNWCTYMVCYMFIQIKMPTLIFGAAVTAFCIVYIAVSLILVYKLAPKTFKLRN